MDIGDRINKIMKHYNLNYKTLAEKIGYSDVAVRKIVLGSTKPKFEFIEALKLTFPNINSEWLLIGVGENGLKIETEKHHFLKEETEIYKPKSDSIEEKIADSVEKRLKPYFEDLKK